MGECVTLRRGGCAFGERLCPLTEEEALASSRILPLVDFSASKEVENLSTRLRGSFPRLISFAFSSWWNNEASDTLDGEILSELESDIFPPLGNPTSAWSLEGAIGKCRSSMWVSVGTRFWCSLVSEPSGVVSMFRIGILADCLVCSSSIVWSKVFSEVCWWKLAF